MNKNKTLVFIIKFFLVCPLSFGQSPQENLDKYWTYRERLFDNFIIDADPDIIRSDTNARMGINLPAERYNFTDTIGSGRLKIYWGSETVTTLSQHIIAMVGEYLLQKNNNLDYSNAQEKIYRGMNAMARLDTLAERVFQSPVNLGPNPCYDYTHLNGFFLRTDVTQEVYDYWSENGMNNWPDNITAESKYVPAGDPEVENQNVISQDQTWNYLLATAMVKTIVDESDVYEDYPCDYVTLDEMARRQAKRPIKLMHSYIDNPNWIWRPTTHDDYPGKWNGNILEQVWQIRNPVTGNAIPAGGYIWDQYFFTDHFEDAGEWITGENLTYNAVGHITLSLLAINHLVPGFVYPPSGLLSMPVTNTTQNNVGKLTLSTISKTINASTLEDLFLNIRKFVDYWNQELPYNPHEMKNFILDHLPMIYILLHDENPNSKLFEYYFSRIEYLLNQAPKNGPSCYKDRESWNDLIWTKPTILRSLIGKDIWGPPGDPYDEPDYADAAYGEFNGIDYMVLFNLYHLVYDKLFNSALVVSESFPTSYVYEGDYDWIYGSQYFLIGHETNWADHTIHSKKNITMNGTVYESGKVRLKGQSVTLSEGFEVKKTGVFIAETNADMMLNFTPPTGNYKSAMKSPARSASNKSIVEETAIENGRLEDALEGDLLLYPNPAENVVELQCGYDINGISIIDARGTVVQQYHEAGTNRITLDISDYYPGLYYISVATSDKKIVKKLMIK